MIGKIDRQKIYRQFLGKFTSGLQNLEHNTKQKYSQDIEATEGPALFVEFIKNSSGVY